MLLPPQALVIAPTRELAIQSADVIANLAANLPDREDPADIPSCAVFVGGLPQANDEKRLRRTCHIAVGTPGRLAALIRSGALHTRTVRMLVLDEADSLFSDSFRKEVLWIIGQLPQQKQVRVQRRWPAPGEATPGAWVPNPVSSCFCRHRVVNCLSRLLFAPSTFMTMDPCGDVCWPCVCR